MADASHANNIDSRVSSLETTVKGLHDDLADVKLAMGEGFRDLQKSMSNASRTNWSFVFGVIAVAGGLWAAGMRPMQNDIDRGQVEKRDIAAAVVEQDKNMNRMDKEVAGLIKDFERHEKANEITHNELAAKVDEIKANGAPITRERLAKVELLVDELKARKP
jgi:hypothetical protein